MERLWELRYYLLVKFIGTIHLVLIFANLISIPLLIVYTPFYIWVPIITMMNSPVVGGTYCSFNRLENHFRRKVGMRQITDRFEELFKRG